MPDQDLRFRVTGHSQTEADFLAQGEQSLADLERALLGVGATLAGHARILDFGCGCGRVTRHLLDAVGKLGSTEVHGCDIDGEAVEWASTHLPAGRFLQTPQLPPLPYPDGHFGLVTNHSVFTHLPEDYQDAWLLELRRVVQPGGVLLLTVAGPHAFDVLVESYLEHPADPTPIQRIFREEGFLYIEDDSWTDGVFPDFYHSTFHNPYYVIQHWGQVFTVEAYLPRAALGFQDIVVLRRPDGPAEIQLPKATLPVIAFPDTPPPSANSRWRLRRRR